MANEEKDMASNLKILKAAEEIFAEEGFDGARVDEIARRAGVNKALIYYYFESKEQILEELSKKHFQGIIDTRKELLKKNNLDQGLTREVIENLIESLVFTLLGERKDFLRTVLIEALKSKSDGTSFFRMMSQLSDDALTKFEKMGYPIDSDQFKTLAFFYGHIPAIIYIAMGEKWAEFNHIDKEKVKSTFIEATTDLRFSLFLDKFNLVMDKKMLDTFSQDKSSFGPEEKLP